MEVQETHEGKDPEDRVDHEDDEPPGDGHTKRVPIAGHLKDDTAEEMKNQQRDEVFVVISPDSVADKRAEVVELVNALVLYLTMLGSDGSPDMTCVTH
jgi:Ethanolamine utilization protein EutJ (predicted chaperonin)